MFSKRNSERYCNEPLSHVENYDKAVADKKRWRIFHRNTIVNGYAFTKGELHALGLFWKRPANELIFVPVTEYNKLISEKYTIKKHSSVHS